MVPAKNNQIVQRGMMMAVLSMGLLFAGARPATADHEYYAITLERVEKALSDGAEKKDIKLAEASLTALGWLQLYGNDSASADLAKRLNEIVAKAYNGTDKMDTVYMKHTSEAYFEMINLKRFQESIPFTCSAEYANITRQRVDKALSQGAGADDFRLAEGSLCALGWIDLFGNDSTSLEKAKQLMNAASKAWPGAQEVYMLQTHEAYAEMINLGRSKHGDCGPTPGTNVAASVQPLMNNLPNGAKLHAGSSLKSTNGRFVFTQQTDGNTCLYDGTKALWCNMINGKGAEYLLMQADGNLCAYTAANAFVWCTMVQDYPDMQTAVLKLQDDGNLVVYTGTTPRWATNTAQQ